ncbi:MAG: FecCD family ABC transporter permease [Promethearchaeota archaeon]
MKSSNRKIFIFFFIFFLFFSIITAVSVGTWPIPFFKVIGIIFHEMGFPIPETWTPGERNIIIFLRLPRILMALIVGAMLSVSGVAAQALFRNPIADPYILGISSAAGSGVALTVVLGVTALFGLFTMPIVSFLFSITAVMIVYRLAMTRYQVSISILLLSGLAVSFFFSACTSLLLYFAENSAHYILVFIMGSLNGTSWDDLFIVYIVLFFGGTLLFYYGRDLNVMVFGDETAQSMGVNVEITKKIVIICMTILTSTAVAFCGSIGFIGLIVPQIMRLLVGNDNRKLILLSALGGGLLLLWADLLARSLLPPLEIPVGIFTSLMGGPFFIYLILKKKKTGELL